MMSATTAGKERERVPNADFLARSTDSWGRHADRGTILTGGQVSFGQASAARISLGYRELASLRLPQGYNAITSV